VAHNNVVLRHFVAKIVFPGGSDRQGTTVLERKPLSATERLWSNLAGIQTFHSQLTSSQHIPTVCETPDSLLASWFQSCVAWSPVYCLNCSAFLVTIIPVYYVTFSKQSDLTANILAEGMRTEQAVHQTNFSRVAKNGLGTRLHTGGVTPIDSIVTAATAGQNFDVDH